MLYTHHDLQAQSFLLKHKYQSMHWQQQTKHGHNQDASGNQTDRAEHISSIKMINEEKLKKLAESCSHCYGAEQ